MEKEYINLDFPVNKMGIYNVVISNESNMLSFLFSLFESGREANIKLYTILKKNQSLTMYFSCEKPTVNSVYLSV